MKMLDSKIIIVSALITAIVGCGSDSGTTTTVTENVNNVAKSADECFSQSLYQVGEYYVEYNYKGGTTVGTTQKNIEIKQLADKYGANQIEMKTIYGGSMGSQTDKLLIWPTLGWVELTERELIQIDAPQITTIKFDTLLSMKLGLFSLLEGEIQRFSVSYDSEAYTLGSPPKSETIDFKQKITFVGFKDININGVEYNTCHIIDEQVYDAGTLISQVFYQSNTGLPLKKINVTKDKDGKIVGEEEETLKSYKFNGTELLN
ncbi:MAG: hypothetical protein COA76_00410 [Moritella sp.]|uniref:hypothetical protein n=1 Tax=Moritella sp. PE36 TaxID=58051 RepID=UPI0005C67192|nr:hypothetical protein [Moritella sp. PE36]PHR90166.1 MAG: hypothetical protein COA76_00410 [Moritella sp.]